MKASDIMDDIKDSRDSLERIIETYEERFESFESEIEDLKIDRVELYNESTRLVTQMRILVSSSILHTEAQHTLKEISDSEYNLVMSHLLPYKKILTIK